MTRAIDAMEELHHLDLVQIDRIQKLVARLQNDLSRWGAALNSEALLETDELEAQTLTDEQLAEMQKGKENGQHLTVEQVLQAVSNSKDLTARDKTRILTSMKDAVWACSNALRSAQLKRKDLLTPEAPPPNMVTQEQLAAMSEEEVEVS